MFNNFTNATNSNNKITITGDKLTAILKLILNSVLFCFQMTMVATQMGLSIGMMAGINTSPGTGGPHIPGLQVQPTMIPIITITQGKMGSSEPT